MFNKDKHITTVTLALFLGLCIVHGSDMNYSYADDEQNTPITEPRTPPMLITVGGEGADIPAFNSRAVQIAIDAVHEHEAGGTIKLNAGEYHIVAPIRLYSNIELVGSGRETILRKADGVSTSFAIDVDYGVLLAEAEDADGFEKGMGIQIWDGQNNSCWGFSTAVITDIQGNTIYFDTPTVRDYQRAANGTISNACSIIEGVDVKNVRIADLVVDGNGATNEPMTGCTGGGVYLHRASDVTIERVYVHHFSGDNFSWQTTERITVRDCESSHARGLGFHPGTGSAESVIENCVSHHNGTDGIFLCWRVQNGHFSGNEVYANGRFGISIGHRDTDNIFTDNHVYENASHGVHFRPETEMNGGHRNTFIDNIIENNGTPDGDPEYGFHISGVTHDIVIRENIIRSNGTGDQQAAVWVGPDTNRITVEANTISGHPDIVNADE